MVRNLLSSKEVEECRDAVSGICKKWYENYLKTGQEGPDWEEVANRRPSWKNGTWKPEDGQEELGFRRLYRMTQYDDFFVQMCRHRRILEVVNTVLGPDIKLLQSMCLMKPPGGIVKNWHQDNAYFRLTPNKVMGVWIALDKATCENGCMHMLPRSHKSGFYKHDADSKFHIDYTMVDTPRPEDVVPVIMKPGDALFFHGHTAHYTPPNVSETRRRSLQYHYASSECQFIRCPNASDPDRIDPSPKPGPEGPSYFDCDPSCAEKKYYYYKKGEMLVTGRDYGEEYI